MIKVAVPVIGSEEIMAVSEVLLSGWYTSGPNVKEFERQWAAYIGTEHAVMVSSGTSALYITMQSLGIGPGDEVILPAMTFFSTATSILRCGATPIFADIDPEIYNLDPNSVKEKMTDKTKAVIPVHFYGHPTDMDRIANVVGKDVFIIEDAAQAHGAEYKGRKCGSLGDAACFDSRTMIKTIDGKKRICDVKIGDAVLTHRGRYRKVTEIHKRHYSGNWVILSCGNMRRTSLWTERSIRATEEHPLLIYRNGKKQWLSIKEITENDWVYTWTKKCEVCGKKIPFFWRLCEYHNPAQLSSSREAISKSKDQGKSRPKHHHKHYYDDILPYAEKLKKEGFRVIPIGDAIPDIIALKDGKIFAYEIENQLVSKQKKLKYNEREKSYYNEIVWIEPERKISLNKNKCRYFIDGNLARVPINKIIREKRERRLVYNLTVEEDESYFASNIAVHNCWSFFATKNMTTATEGGAITTDNEEVAEKARIIRSHGMTDRNTHAVLGYNDRMCELGAAIGIEQLKKLDELNEARSKNGAYLTKHLQELDIPWLGLPVVKPWAKHAWFWYPIRVAPEVLGMSGWALRQKLYASGIETRHRYNEPLYKQPVLKNYLNLHDYDGDYCPNAEKVAGNMLGLPNHFFLCRADLDYIIDTIKEIK